MNKDRLRDKVIKNLDSISLAEEFMSDLLPQRLIIWRRFSRSRMGMAGLCIIVVFYLVALFADFLAPYAHARRFTYRVHTPPQRIHIADEKGLRMPFVYDYQLSMSTDGLERLYAIDKSSPLRIRFFMRGDPYHFLGLWPCDRHLFGVEDGGIFILGSDRMGRDLFSRILHGSRVSLTIGLLGVAITLFLGTLIGTISGLYGGWIDNLIQRCIEILMVFPTIPLWMALAAALPPHWSQLRIYFGIITILSFVGWGGLARQVRGMVLSLKERDYIKAALSFGAGKGYLLFRHLIPGCYSHLIVIATLAVPGIILGETALSFLGLGIRSPMTSWGVLLEEAQHIRVVVSYPWLLVPALPVLLIVVAFNFVGDALRDAVDPHS